MLLKRQPLNHLTDYALSLSLSACFYALASWCPSQRTRDNSKRRGLIACVQIVTPTANFWAQIILDPYRWPLTLTFLLVSTRGLFQDTMFNRLLHSTLSEDASEVLVQPLHCGTYKIIYNRIYLSMMYSVLLCIYIWYIHYNSLKYNWKELTIKNLKLIIFFRAAINHK